MNIGLIICTYQRPEAVRTLLQNLTRQSTLPVQILIVDSSDNSLTREVVGPFKNALPIDYFLVAQENKGLTRQRNFGVSMLRKDVEIVAFLDDDLELDSQYFKEIHDAFIKHPDAIAIGGIDMCNNFYRRVETVENCTGRKYHCVEGWVRPEPRGYIIRKTFGLMSKLPAGIFPPEGHPRTGLPPSGKSYKVDTLMGGIMCVKKRAFSVVRFNTFFEGYGLYEDADFSISLQEVGVLYCCTAAKVYHHHAPGGRPAHYNFGKMVIRNGWYVWKRRFPQNSPIAIIKWHLISWLQIIFMLRNFKNSNTREEIAGRISGWFGVIIAPPKMADHQRM